MARLLAVLIIFIPGIIATIGIKLMRDSLFNIVHPILFNVIIQFIVGVIFFVAGLGFVGGFIFHRDRKRNLTKGKFKKKES
jgi:energy-coupling factor transporter transmembrane protein EcfT